MNIFPPDPARCPLCGETNNCQLCTPMAYKGPCWCASRDIPAALLARVPPESRNRACICKHCVDQFELELKLSPHLEPRPTRRSSGSV